MRMPSRPMLTGLLSSVVWMSLGGLSKGELLLQEVKNKSLNVTADDLTLTFTKGIRLHPSLEDNIGTVFGFQTPGTNEYKFENLSGFAPGAVAQIRFDDGGSGARIDIDDTKSFWTLKGVHVVNSLASIAQSGSFDLGGGGGAFVTITNDEPFAIVYNDIQSYSNNLLSNYDLSGFDTPTGTLVAGVPSSLTLDPGESASLPLADVSPDAYQLLLADVAAVSDPTQTYRIALASAVPEPSSFSLLGSGGLALLLALTRWSRPNPC